MLHPVALDRWFAGIAPESHVCTFALTGALHCNRTRVVAKRCIFGQPKRQDHDDTAVDPGIARQPDTQ